MNKGLTLVTALLVSPACIGAGPAGDIVSFACSQAIASALQFIEKEKLEINLKMEDGEMICIGPVGGKIILRVQTPEMEPANKKHYFNIDAENYSVIKHSFSQ